VTPAVLGAPKDEQDRLGRQAKVEA